MKYTHRSQGPRKGTGNAFVPSKIEPSRRKRRNQLSASQKIALARQDPLYRLLHDYWFGGTPPQE